MKRQVKIPDRVVRGKMAFTKESRALLQSPPGAGVPETLSSAVTLAEVMIGRRRIANDIKVLLQTGAKAAVGSTKNSSATPAAAAASRWGRFRTGRRSASAAETVSR